MTNQPSLTYRLLLLSIVLTSCIGFDQYTKKLAIDHLGNSPSRSLYNDTIRIQHVKNPGGFLGMGGSLSQESRFWIFCVSNGLLLSGICLFLWKKWNMPMLAFFSMSLFLAGGIGNQIDRILQQGLVTDFLNLGIGSFRTGIFNVADVAITVGILLLGWTWMQESAQVELNATRVASEG